MVHRATFVVVIPKTWYNWIRAQLFEILFTTALAIVGAESLQFMLYDAEGRVINEDNPGTTGQYIETTSEKEE